MPRANLSPIKAVDTHRFFPRLQPHNWGCRKCRRRFIQGSTAYLFGPFPMKVKWLLLCKACTEFYGTDEGKVETALLKMGILPQPVQEKTEWE